MTKTVHHILNGSCLKAQFPKEIEGEIIVMNECLVDGDVKGDSLDKLYKNRAKFLSVSYDVTIQSYFDKVVLEFNKIKKLPSGAEVNLWFEEDLFCQVNFWFVLHLIKSQTNIQLVNLVLPNKENRYGFGGMDNQSLLNSFSQKIEISGSHFERLSQFWQFYRTGDVISLLKESKDLNDDYSFLLPSINAHIERTPVNGKPGRPEQSLKDIMKELQTIEFTKVFGEFCKREAIYGYGDLQVKRLFDRLITNNE